MFHTFPLNDRWVFPKSWIFPLVISQTQPVHPHLAVGFSPFSEGNLSGGALGSGVQVEESSLPVANFNWIAGGAQRWPPFCPVRLPAARLPLLFVSAALPYGRCKICLPSALLLPSLLLLSASLLLDGRPCSPPPPTDPKPHSSNKKRRRKKKVIDYTTSPSLAIHFHTNFSHFLLTDCRRAFLLIVLKN